MAKSRHDARLIYSASESDANMLWATRFFAPDPFTFIEKRGKRYVMVTDLELDRARQQATVDRVIPYMKHFQKVRDLGIPYPKPADVLASALQELKIRSVLVPSTFPLALGDDLRDRGFRVDPERDAFWPAREIKTPEETQAIQRSLAAAEFGMEAGIQAVRQSRIRRDGFLGSGGTILTSEALRSIIDSAVLSKGCVPSHTIVASGEQGIDPHNEGSGPIRAHTPIILDIFPRSQTTGFFGDITRTVVRGRASERLRAAYHAVQQAQQIGFSRIRNGADGVEIHFELVAFFEKAGFPTGNIDGRMQGFFHGTGHGLGLDVHEAPSIGARARDRLRTGHVVTVEPGLYYSGMGGVRLEDVVLVEKEGCRNLVRYPKVLEV